MNSPTAPGAARHGLRAEAASVRQSIGRSIRPFFLSELPVARGYQIEGNVFQANTQRKALRLGKPVRLVHNPEHQIIRFLVQSQFAHLASPVICRRVWSQPVPPVAARPCCRVWSQPAPPVAARPCCRVWSQPVPPVAARPCCRARCRPAAPVPGLSGILFHDPDFTIRTHGAPATTNRKPLRSPETLGRFLPRRATRR